MASNTTRDVLRRAADEIETNGWFSLGKTGHSDGKGSLCVMVAIDRAVEGIAIHHRSGLFIAGLRAFEAHVGQHPPDWNDATGRTKGEVLATLRAAAESA